jgi:DNA (cytosine-5)-methyltransferase 1
MKLLDLFCGAGGASAGYVRAGFEVTGVDIAPMPRYPYEFHQTDALEFLKTHWRRFDVIHASPPCQAYSKTRVLQEHEHPELIDDTRKALAAIGAPYVIENVPYSPLAEPLMLCGAMFGLRVYRHRLFESNVELSAPPHPEHIAKVAKMGRPPGPGEFMHVVGNFAGAQQAREAMGIDWMIRPEISQAIPPAYTEHIGAQLLDC